MAGVEQYGKRILAIDGHQRVALFIGGGVQGDGQVGPDFLLPEPLDAWNDPARRKSDVPGRERDAIGIEHDPHRGHRRVVVEHRFALAHENDIRLRRELFAIFLERDQDLPDDFSGREVADQTELRGQAKVAIDGAAGLRRDANRLALAKSKRRSTYSARYTCAPR